MSSWSLQESLRIHMLYVKTRMKKAEPDLPGDPPFLAKSDGKKQLPPHAGTRPGWLAGWWWRGLGWLVGLAGLAGWLVGRLAGWLAG